MIVRKLSELSRADVPVAGGKGANLGEMIRAGFPVPPGFVVTAQAYADQARQWGLAERAGAHLAANDWEAAALEAAELFRSGALLPAIEAAVRGAYRELGAARVAVRSSATAEDLADASFAGQQETYLNVTGEDDVLASLRKCWASLYSARALHYRHARGIAHLDVAIAVVVQAMVPAEAAGVLFTVDPVAQRSDRMLLSAAPGLGEAVVSGQRRGDTYRIRREPYGSGDAASSKSAPAIVDRDLETPGKPALSNAALLDLARFGLSLEAHFGCPQDIEFAVAAGKIQLLQSRPITTLGAAEIEPIEPLGELDFLQKRSFDMNADRFPVAPKPLDQWYLRGSEHAVRHMMNYLGFDVAASAESQYTWREAYLPPKARPSWRLLGIPGRAARGLRGDWMAWWNGEPMERVRAISGPLDVAELGDIELVRLMDQAVDVFGSVLAERFEPMIGIAGSGLLGLAARVAVGPKRAPEVLAHLLGGIQTRTTETNRALYQLAQRALAAGPEVAGPIAAGRSAELGESDAGRAYLGAFHAFLDEHGHREGMCLLLSSPTWKQDPEMVWSILRGFMQLTEPPEDRGPERARAALEEIESGLRLVPWLKEPFRDLLQRVRANLMFRENTHFDLLRPLPRMQSLVAEMGRRLHQRAVLPAPGDIVYLTEAEVKEWLGGQAPSASEAEKLLKRRRATYQVVNAKWQKRRVAGAGTGNELRGVGASAGVVRAKARIIRDERQFDRLKPGEILVCSYTNPSWTPLFSYAAGVVTDTGGAASHAAIVAREYGIPAVMGAAGATERITDGQEILVDGSEGRVTILQS